MYGTQAREPGQPEKGETRTISVLEYAGETRAWLRSFHKNRSGDPRAEFRIDGTAGSIRGTIGLMYDYPRGRADTLELLFARVADRRLAALSGDDALDSDGLHRADGVAAGRPSPAAGAPHPRRRQPRTLEIVHALYRSGSEHVVVAL